MTRIFKSIMGLPYTVRACLIAFLSTAKLIPSMGTKEAKESKKRLKKEYRQMKKWADNFQDIYPGEA